MTDSLEQISRELDVEIKALHRSMMRDAQNALERNNKPYLKTPKIQKSHENAYDEFNVPVNLVTLKERPKNNSTNRKYEKSFEHTYSYKGNRVVAALFEDTRDEGKSRLIIYARMYGARHLDLSDKIKGLKLTDERGEILTNKAGKKLEMQFNRPVNGVALQYNLLPSHNFFVRLYQ